MVAGLIARARSLWRGVRRRGDVEREMAEEFGHHLALRAADLVRQGLTPAEARRRARLEFGCAELHKDDARAARGLRAFDGLRVSWLDFRLGFRMLVKYPGLTIVGGLAMAFAIWVGAGAFEIVTQIVAPRLPLPEGERVVGIQSWDAAAGRPEGRVLHDLVAWQRELRSVTELGAFREVARNLAADDGESRPVAVAEISASAFRLTRVRPLLGRTLVPADEHPGAPAVAVLGHDVWRVRFGGDSGVVGRSVRLGRAMVTVVGVMPAGYGFPVSQGLWVPLRANPLDYPRGEGPSLQLFARLAPGVSLADAQSELTTWGRRAAADDPSTHQHLRPLVMPYAQSILPVGGAESLVLRSGNLFLVLLLVLVCGNVALLVFARATTREGELTVRAALGAGRGRIVAQLFAEALVLGALAAALGLGAAGRGLRWALAVAEAEAGRRLPFWFHGDLSPLTLAYALGLTLLAAAIAGVLPALKVTRGLQTRLRQAAAGSGGVRLGGVWTAVIVAQVAVTTVFPSVAFFVQRDVRQVREIVADFPAGEFLSARVTMDREPPPDAPLDTSRAAFATRFRSTYQELERRLAAEPGVLAVTFAERLPRTYHPARLIEVDAGGAAPMNPDFPGGYRVSSAAVDADYFDVLGAPVRRGRGFHPGDLAADAPAVLVNESFVRLVLGGRNPIGRRVRYRRFEETGLRVDGEPGPWHEIVGVVSDLGMSKAHDPKVAGIYHPLRPDAATALAVAVRVRGEPAAFAPRLRAVAAAVDPGLRVDALAPMDELSDGELKFLDFWFRLTLLVSAVAVGLSLTGIYAVLAFTVARRTREIGVRVALGSDPRRIVLAIFRLPLTQVGLGVAAGGVTVGVLGGAAQSTLRPWHAAALAAYVASMFAVCLLACIVPTRRALRIQPTEALRAEG